MSLAVVGSIAFDAVKTPFGERERMLGGSAVHFALAASFFCDVSIVGPVGDKTFFWKGHYQYDLNQAHTDDTQLNVFGDFEPKLSDEVKSVDNLFLANIHPQLQMQVRKQCTDTRLAGLDSMNLWIETE